MCNFNYKNLENKDILKGSKIKNHLKCHHSETSINIYTYVLQDAYTYFGILL